MLVAVAISMTNYSFMKKQSEESLKSEVESSLALMSKGINEWKDAKSNVVNAGSKSFVQGKDLYETLEQGKESGDFIYMYMGVAEGKMHIFPKVDLPPDYDPRIRPWYKGAMAKNKTVLTAPYEDATSGNLVVTFAAPMPQGKGVMAADVSLNQVVETVLLSDLGGVGYAMLVDSSGIIIAHPDQKWVLKPIEDFSVDMKRISISTLSGNNELKHLNTMEGDKLTAFKAVPGTDWYVGYMLEEQKVLQPLNDMLSLSIIASVVVAFVALVAIYVLLTVLLSPIRKLIHAMEEISSGDGDLTRRLVVSGKDELSLVARHFNEFVSKIQTLILDASESARQLTQYSSRLANSALESERGVENQLHEIEQVAAAIQEMSNTSAEVAAHANESAQIAKASGESSQQGLAEVSKTNSNMQSLANEIQGATQVISELDSHAQNINSILSTIQGIAEQTNLLALNAAIEAARAGEQGRGFAVVADEVRVLSKRTHESTEEIQSMIEQLQSRTQNAVKIMDTSETLTRETVENVVTVADNINGINMGIQNMAEMAGRISEASNQQNVATDEISRIATAINDAAIDMTGSASSTKQLAVELSDTAVSLDKLLNRFKL